VKEAVFILGVSLNNGSKGSIFPFGSYKGITSVFIKEISDFGLNGSIFESNFELISTAGVLFMFLLATIFFLIIMGFFHDFAKQSDPYKRIEKQINVIAIEDIANFFGIFKPPFLWHLHQS
jgi:hypothetical protein